MPHRSKDSIARWFVSRTGVMRITPPHPILSPFPSSTASSSPSSAVKRIAAFLRPGNVAVLTGAGVSVDSGIRAYRGKNS